MDNLRAGSLSPGPRGRDIAGDSLHIRREGQDFQKGRTGYVQVHRDVVAIGASAGGIEALSSVLRALPADFPAAVLVVQHTGVRSESMLSRVLARQTLLPLSHPADGERIEPGRIYVAPPDHHMVMKDDHVRILRGPRENRNRPAIDPLFRSVALARGRRAVGVVLTGLLDDGTEGLMVIRRHGGAAVVEDPLTARFESMPRHALQRVPDACVVELEEIGAQLVRLTREELPAVGRPAVGRRETETADAVARKEADLLERELPEMEEGARPGRPSAFACPDCGGVLWEMGEDGFLRFRCRVGHAFTARHLRAEQQQAVETSLWSALRALEESRALHQRLAEFAQKAGRAQTARNYEEHASTLAENGRVLREFFSNMDKTEED